MEKIEELTACVSKKSLDYLKESGEEIKEFPTSIVDYVIEFTRNGCHFPKHFKEKDIVEDLEKGKSALAMACIDIYSKIGAEGQVAHSENGVSRTYESSWITFDLLSNFPNYVTILK